MTPNLTTEASRFREAFYTVLLRNLDKAPGPTAINTELGKVGRQPRTPLNVLNGRMAALRRELLMEAGFVQDHEGGRWRRG